MTWNRFGTPKSLIRYGDFLATGLSSNAVTAARSFLSANVVLFRLSTAEVAALELVADSEMAGGAGHAVMFRQRFGSLPATKDGLIIVGVSGGNVARTSRARRPAVRPRHSRRR